MNILRTIALLLAVATTAAGCGSSEDNQANATSTSVAVEPDQDEQRTTTTTTTTSTSTTSTTTTSTTTTSTAAPTSTTTSTSTTSVAPTLSSSAIDALAVDEIDIGIGIEEDAEKYVGFREFSFGAGSVWHPSAGGVLRIDATTGELAATFDLSAESDVLVAAGKAWVIAKEGDNEDALFRIDVGTNEVAGFTDDHCGGDSKGFAETDEHLWHACGSQINRHNLSTGELVDTIDLGIEDNSLLAIDGAVWASTGRRLVRLDETTGETIAEIRIEGADQAWRPILAGGDLWIPDAQNGTVTRISTQTNEIVATITVGQAPFRPVANDDAVWVPNRSDDSISRIDITTNDVTTVTYEDSDATLAITDDGLWQAQHYGFSVSLVDPTNGQVLRVFDVGDEPTVISFPDSNVVWVYNQDDGTFARIGR